MGLQDLDRLEVVANYANSFPDYNFQIDVDTNNSNNTILIDEYGNVKRVPISREDADKFRKHGFKPFVPDLIDFKMKKIIEYQEEPGPPKPGAKLARKGHDEFSDSDKDLYYKIAGFDQLKIWESDKDWTDKIDEFLDTNNDL